MEPTATARSRPTTLPPLPRSALGGYLAELLQSYDSSEFALRRPDSEKTVTAAELLHTLTPEDLNRPIATGTIGSINTSVSVQYQKNCGSGRKYTISYTNQVVINSSSFSAGGDSGSLILTNTSCAHPVALLYAGSSTDTIGNPISDVLSGLAAVGHPVSFVGQNCTGPTSPQSGAQSFQLSQQALDRANAVLEQHRSDLMSRPAVLGVGLGAVEDNSQPAIVVYVDKTSSLNPQLPAQIDNVPVRTIMTDPFIAY